ncbi:MAG: hypothetical protein KJ737_25145 [Proteobacteria bacterium]|nr:hypothetical protein [Pseudomonadota bacterium]
MKTGLILYVVGDEPEMFDVKAEVLKSKLALNADRVEIVARREGHYDIHDAWMSLIVKGMTQIRCLTAQFEGSKSLKPTGRELRLC